MPENNAAYDALVLDARLRQSLVTIRSLGQRGLRVAALESTQGDTQTELRTLPAFSSRWCRQAFVAASGLDAYTLCLDKALATTRASVLIVSSDSTLAFVRQQREELARRIQLALASEQALAIAVNKQQTLAIAQQLGLDIPRSIEVKDRSMVEDAVRELGLPLVVKPVESWLWDQQQAQPGIRVVCKVANSVAEAYLAVEELHRYGGTTLFQPFLSGRRESVNLLYARGTVHACFTQWAKRTYPQLGGTSVYRQSIITPPDIGAQAERLVREIDLEGYSEIEFRRDAVGKPYLMEINPRLSASIELAVRAGVDFPSLLFQWARGERVENVKTYCTGIWMRHLGGDIDTTVQSLTHADRPEVVPASQAISAFLLAFLRPAYYDYWLWQDPVPALKAVSGFLRSNLKLLFHKLRSRIEQGSVLAAFGGKR